MIGLVAALVVPANALAVAPVKGASYHATPTADVDPLLEVDAAGTKLRRYRIGGVIPCTNGRTEFFGLNDVDEPPTAIAPDGSFSYASKPDTIELDVGTPKFLKGVQQTTFSGTFVDADTAVVTVTTTFRSSKFNCTGTTRRTLGRAGTRLAPFRDGRLATGRYRAAGRGITIGLLVVNTPVRAVDRLVFSGRVRCRDGRTIRTPTFSFPPAFRISPGGVLRLAGGSLRGGTFKLTAAFSRLGGVYRVKGRVRFRAVVTRRGKRVTTCKSYRTFTGRFVSGPKNRF